LTVDQHLTRRLAAILAADVVGYTRLMGEDETGTLLQLNLVWAKAPSSSRCGSGRKPHHQYEILEASGIGCGEPSTRPPGGGLAPFRREGAQR